MSKKKVAWIILGLFVLCGTLWQAYLSFQPTEECAPLLSELYSHYRQALRLFVQTHPSYDGVKHSASTPFNVKVKTLLAVCEQESAEDRKTHERFVEQLRATIETAESSPWTEQESEGRQFLHDLVRWVYLEVDLKEKMATFLYERIPPPDEPLYTYLPKMQQRLHDRFQGMSHHLHWEDGFLHGNLPFRVVDLPAPSFTRVVRFAKPLCPRFRFSWTPYTLSPEFLFFLRMQPSHLYVNLMKRKSGEGRWSHQIENLEEEFPGLLVITLDKDSSFYWQDEDETSSSETFKQLFLDKMFSRNGNYFWSRHLEQEKWKEVVSHLLNDIHKSYFGKQAEMNKSERRDFIEVTYLAILDNLVERWHPASLNITCNQGMDRGPSLMALWMWKKQLVSDQELAAWVFSPPLLIHNRASHGSRIERLVSAAKRLNQNE